jgi:hypothetical protein
MERAWEKERRYGNNTYFDENLQNGNSLNTALTFLQYESNAESKGLKANGRRSDN